MIHSFLWIIYAPIISQENIDVIYAISIDSVVKTFVPNPCENPELHLPEDLPENMRDYILNELECILSIVNQYIDCNLDHRNKYSEF